MRTATNRKKKRGTGPPRMVQIQPSAGRLAKLDRGFDLNGNAVTSGLLTNKYVQPTVHVFTVSLFLYAIYQTFAGPQDGGTNFGAVAFFGLWWAPVMLVSLLLVGRAWCYFCPIGAITDFLQRFSLNRRFPTFLKPNWKVLGLNLSVLSIAAVTFLFARLPLYKFGVSYTPWKAGIYFLIFLVLAVGLTLVFRQRVFCRYFCPATGVMTVTARLSPIELRQDRETDVPDCMTAEFKSEYLSTERRCVSCMNCVTGQPEVPARLRFRWPGSGAVRQRILLADEALIALIIWAVFPVDHVLGSAITENIPAIQALPGIWAGTLPYFMSVAATILGFAAVNRIAAWWSGLDARETFIRFAFAYAPLGIMFQLGRHVVTGLLENGGGLVNNFAAGLGVGLDLPVAWASPGAIAAWSQFSASGGLWLGVVWGGVIAWAIASDMADATERRLKAVLPHLAFMAAVTFAVVTHLT
ncbi:MAG: 4Fe-4S binding protein [Gemmatimonadota bacterium]